MQISIEQKDGVEKILNVTIPSEEIQSQVESKINEYGTSGSAGRLDERGHQKSG